MLRGSEQSGDKWKGSDREGEVHLALHHTLEGSCIAWANDAVLKLAKHCKQHTLACVG